MFFSDCWWTWCWFCKDQWGFCISWLSHPAPSILPIYLWCCWYRIVVVVVAAVVEDWRWRSWSWCCKNQWRFCNSWPAPLPPSILPICEKSLLSLVTHQLATWEVEKALIILAQLPFQVSVGWNHPLLVGKFSNSSMVIVISIIRIILCQIQCKLDDETYDTTEVLALDRKVYRMRSIHWVCLVCLISCSNSFLLLGFICSSLFICCLLSRPALPLPVHN